MKACIFNVTVKCIPGYNSFAAHQLNQFVPITGCQVPKAAQQAAHIHTNSRMHIRKMPNAAARCTGVCLAAAWSPLVQQVHSTFLFFFLNYFLHFLFMPTVRLILLLYLLLLLFLCAKPLPWSVASEIAPLAPARHDSIIICCCYTFRLAVGNCSTCF